MRLGAPVAHDATGCAALKTIGPTRCVLTPAALPGSCLAAASADEGCGALKAWGLGL